MSTVGGGVNIIKDNLILYLDASNVKSYPGTGTTWTGLSKNTYNGTLTNGPTFNSNNGGSIVFDGVDDFAPMNSVINTGQNFSVFSWIYPGSISIRNAIFGNGYPYQSLKGWLFATATGYASLTDTFFISIGQDERVATTANNTLERNKWNYVGVTVSGGGTSIKLYKNGIETQYITRVQGALTIDYSRNESGIARRDSSLPEVFNGRIAQIKMYTKVLTDQEISQNFNATRERFGV